MNKEYNITRFESELGKVQRPGFQELINYIRKSDFYTAPASTRYHLSCEGGLLQHSLNVLDALRGLLAQTPDGAAWTYNVGGVAVATIPDDTVTVVALLHDICKTFFYKVSSRNVKDEKTGKWEKVPYYTVDDKMPLGHGPKSAMIVKQYMELTTPEMYAIWHHMGFSGIGNTDTMTLTQAIEKYPLIWALHTADVMASHFMEDANDNKEAFRYKKPEAPEAPVDSIDDDSFSGWEEALPLDDCPDLPEAPGNGGN